MHLFEQTFWKKDVEYFLSFYQLRCTNQELEDISLTRMAADIAMALLSRIYGLEWNYTNYDTLIEEVIEEVNIGLSRTSEGYLIVSKEESDRRDKNYGEYHLEILLHFMEVYRKMEANNKFTQDTLQILEKCCLEVLKLNYVFGS